MHLKCHRRFKDGKEHRYWSIVESRRCRGGRVVQRHVLYLGEINDSQKASWLRCIEACDPQTRAQVRLRDFAIHRSRQWGACWLFLQLWEELQLPRFWMPSRRSMRCGRRGSASPGSPSSGRPNRVRAWA